MKPKLPDVALLCCDTRDALASLESLHRSLGLVDFGECIYVTSRSAIESLPDVFVVSPLIRTVLIDPIKSIPEYSHFLLTGLGGVTEKPFILVTQWDSWVLSPAAWSDEFLRYDYIGAVWPHHTNNRIGNGGFSLRSRKLVNAAASLAANAKPENLLVEDDFICRMARPALESLYGCQFPTEKIANQFSSERLGWDGRSFGFHGLLNFGRVFDSRALIQRLEMLDEGYFGDRHSVDLIRYLFSEGRLVEAKYVLGRRVALKGWSTKNLKLLVSWFFRALLAPRTFFQPVRRTSD
jgi:hypothetical protein